MNIQSPGSRPTYLAIVWFLLGAVLSQVGLAFFGIPLEVHRVLGSVIGLASVFLVLLSFAIRLPRATRAVGALIFLLLVLQPVFISLKAQAPPLAAVHAVNAFVILALALIMALDSEEAVRITALDKKATGKEERQLAAHDQ